MPGITRSFTKTFTNNSQFKLILDWSYSQNIGNNTSTVTAILKVQSMSSGVASGWVNKSAGISINGNNMGFTVNPNMGANQTKELARRSYTFSHNGDGTKSVNISANVNYTGIRWNGGSLGNVTVGGNATLKTIPRASSIGTITGSQIGSAITIPISRASGSFIHDVSLTLGGQTVSATGVATSATLTPNLANFCGQLPSSTSGTATVKVVTKNGGTVIGTTTKSHVIYVPDSVRPSIVSIAYGEHHPSLKDLGLAHDVFVQGKSSVGITIGSNGAYGSVIRDVWIGIDNVASQNNNDAIFHMSHYPWVVGDNLPVTVTTRDSRGRWAEMKSRIYVVPFSPPSINTFFVGRVNNSSRIEIVKKISASRIMQSKSSYLVSVDRQVGGGWTTIHSEYDANTEYITFDGYDTDKSHVFRIRVGDYFEEISSQVTLSTSKTIMDLNKDVGVGFGKVHERGAVDVGGQMYVSQKIFAHGEMDLRSTTSYLENNEYFRLVKENGLTHALISNSGQEDILTLHLYNRYGDWSSYHRFYSSGDVVFDKTFSANVVNSKQSIGTEGTIWAAGNIITDGAFYQGGVPVRTTKEEGVVWQGAIDLDEGKRVKVPYSIDESPNGWIVTTSDSKLGVVGGTEKDIVIHKSKKVESGEVFLSERDELSSSSLGSSTILVRVVEF